MTENKIVAPLKAGILIVVTSYFLFTLHAMFTLQWWGEWNIQGTFNFGIFITDISALPGLIVRFIGSLIALATVAIYLTKKDLNQATGYRLVKAILILEALYWLSLLPSGIWGILPSSNGFNAGFFFSTGLPCTVASISIPIALFLLARNLGAKKPQQRTIKWSMIAGIFYILAFWLNNSGMWIVIVIQKGIEYVISKPEFLISFSTTIVGLLFLLIYMVYFANKSRIVEKVQDLGFGAMGAILTALGVYYLWNYLTWIFFGGWNEWYAWILGHNLDLWLLSLPLVGLPLLFYRKPKTKTPEP